MTTAPTETFHSYNVTFALDFSSITTTVMAMSVEAAEPLARDQLISDHPAFEELLDEAFEVQVQLLDKDVL